MCIAFITGTMYCVCMVVYFSVYIHVYYSIDIVNCSFCLSSYTFQCPIDGDDVHHTMTELVNEMFSQPLLNTSLCPHNESNVQDKQNCTRELYSFVSQVLLQLNVTTECCLVNQTHCGHHHHGVYNTNTAESEPISITTVDFDAFCF